MIASPKFYTGGLRSFFGLPGNVTPSPAKAATPAPAPAAAPVTAPAPTPAKPTKLETVSSYSAPAGTVVSTATVDALLKQNIDKGDPNLVTGEALKSLEQKGKIDPSLGNLLSSNAAVAKGAAALGVEKIERINQLVGAKEVGYSGDLVGAAKSLGIDTTGFTKTVSGPMGTTQTVIDKEKLYNAVNDKANQIGLYAITERDPGKTGSSDNATHVTTYYQNANGVLQPIKDANGKTATTTFKADTYTKDEGFFEGLVSGVRDIATEMSPIISAALPNLGLTGLQLLAAQSAQAIATGASPTDVLKGAIGSLAAAQVPQFLDELKIVSAASPALKSAINNAAVQATFAAFTDQNIALNAIAGAIGGAAAELSKDLGDPALQKAIGEFTKNKALGMSDVQAGMAAAQDYAQSISGKKAADRTAAQNQVIDAFSQPKSAGVGTQIGEATAGLDRTLATTPGRETVPLPEGSAEAGAMLPPVTVTGEVDRFPGADVPAADIEAAMRIPSAPMGGSTPILTPSLAGITRPSAPTTQGRDQQIINLTGITRPSGQQPSAQPSAGEQTLPPVEVIGEREEPSLPPVEVVGEREEPQARPAVEETTATETASQTFPLTPQQPDTVILDLISGGGTRRGQRMPTAAESESMAALTQALRIGDPGDALFGGKLGRRRNVWNVESLRLRDELGG